jgi:hypothetical protein
VRSPTGGHRARCARPRAPGAASGAALRSGETRACRRARPRRRGRSPMKAESRSSSAAIAAASWRCAARAGRGARSAASALRNDIRDAPAPAPGCPPADRLRPQAGRSSPGPPRHRGRDRGRRHHGRSGRARVERLPCERLGRQPEATEQALRNALGIGRVMSDAVRIDPAVDAGRGRRVVGSGEARKGHGGERDGEEEQSHPGESSGATPASQGERASACGRCRGFTEPRQPSGSFSKSLDFHELSKPFGPRGHGTIGALGLHPCASASSPRPGSPGSSRGPPRPRVRPEQSCASPPLPTSIGPRARAHWHSTRRAGGSPWATYAASGCARRTGACAARWARGPYTILRSRRRAHCSRRRSAASTRSAWMGGSCAGRSAPRGRPRAPGAPDAGRCVRCHE